MTITLLLAFRLSSSVDDSKFDSLLRPLGTRVLLVLKTQQWLNYFKLPLVLKFCSFGYRQIAINYVCRCPVVKQVNGSNGPFVCPQNSLWFLVK